MLVYQEWRDRPAWTQWCFLPIRALYLDHQLHRFWIQTSFLLHWTSHVKVLYIGPRLVKHFSFFGLGISWVCCYFWLSDSEVWSNALRSKWKLNIWLPDGNLWKTNWRSQKAWNKLRDTSTLYYECNYKKICKLLFKRMATSTVFNFHRDVHWEFFGTMLMAD